MTAIIMAGIAVVAVGFMCVFLAAMCRDGLQHEPCLIVRLASLGMHEVEGPVRAEVSVGNVELRPIATRRQALTLHMVPQMYWQHHREPDDKAMAG